MYACRRYLSPPPSADSIEIFEEIEKLIAIRKSYTKDHKRVYLSKTKRFEVIRETKKESWIDQGWQISVLIIGPLSRYEIFNNNLSSREEGRDGT